MFTLSICMIVKNEEPVLARCLEGAKRIADELIVVDTGSEDASIDIARRFTDKVYEHPWQNSFCEARNYSISLASGDYVMWLDADEVIDEENAKRILQLKANMPENVDAVFLIYDNGNGVFGDYIFRERIVRRQFAHFVGDIHETIHIEPGWNCIFRRDIRTLHDKKHLNEPTRNITMLERNRDRRGAFTDMELAYYCRELLVHEQPEKVTETYRELRSRGPKPQSLYHGLIFAAKAWMQLGEYEECAREIAAALETAEPTAYMLCQLGLCLEKLGKGAEAESAYRLAMQTPERPESLCLQFFGYTDYFPALRMTSICRRAGRITEARAWNTAARKACPQGLEWKLDAVLLGGAEKSKST